MNTRLSLFFIFAERGLLFKDLFFRPFIKKKETKNLRVTHWLQALLEQQLAVEKSKMETEKKRFQIAIDEKVGSLVLFPRK